MLWLDIDEVNTTFRHKKLVQKNLILAEKFDMQIPDDEDILDLDSVLKEFKTKPKEADKADKNNITKVEEAQHQEEMSLTLNSLLGEGEEW